MEALEDAEDEEELEDILAGEDYETADACAEAARLAGDNDAVLTGCGARPSRLGYQVGVRTRDTVGDSPIPGTENLRAETSATAVLLPRCEVSALEEDEVELRCEERDWSFAPDDAEAHPEARDLFGIALED